jgi:Protein of unknown function (DUF3363)
LFISVTSAALGRDVKVALNRRARRLVDMGLATAKDGNIHMPVSTVAPLERREVERVGKQMARDRGLTYIEAMPASISVAASPASPASSADVSQ